MYDTVNVYRYIYIYITSEVLVQLSFTTHDSPLRRRKPTQPGGHARRSETPGRSEERLPGGAGSGVRGVPWNISIVNGDIFP